MKAGTSIRRRRKALKWNQQKLAEVAYLSIDTIVVAEASGPISDSTREAIETALRFGEAEASVLPRHTGPELSLSANHPDKEDPHVVPAGSVTVRASDLAALHDLARKLFVTISAIIDAEPGTEGPRVAPETPGNPGGPTSNRKPAGGHGR